MNLGPSEILLIILVMLLLFGGKRLPEMARNLGRGLAEVRRFTFEVKRQMNEDTTLPSQRLTANPNAKPSIETKTPPPINVNPASQPRTPPTESGPTA